MILESAMLYIDSQKEQAFEDDFKKASIIISSMKGYLSHELQRCMEVKGKYLLLVRWETLEDHTIGFRSSEEYNDWKTILHHYYEPFPIVEHYEIVNL